MQLFSPHLQETKIGRCTMRFGQVQRSSTSHLLAFGTLFLKPHCSKSSNGLPICPSRPPEKSYYEDWTIQSLIRSIMAIT